MIQQPLYEGMPVVDRTFDLPRWGEIRLGGVCKDDYARLRVWSHNEHVWKLQKAALESLKDATDALGYDIVCTGTWRSCALQTQLWNSDKLRFAPPQSSGHCRGLAIDVSMSMPARRRSAIRKALFDRRWYQSRPTDEPWHYSFGGSM